MADELKITKVFDAPRKLVWEAWTKPKIAKQWWGPEEFSAPNIKINLKVGEKYIFAMRGPKGSQWDKNMYSAGIYKEIIPNEKLVVTDYFSDEKGNKLTPKQYGMDSNFPSENTVTVLFEDIEKSKTKLSIIYSKPKNKAQMDAMLKSGMKQGWDSSLNKLQKLVE
jgi:uncharacterized protein YndB with AHSA1/START domain